MYSAFVHLFNILIVTMLEGIANWVCILIKVVHIVAYFIYYAIGQYFNSLWLLLDIKLFYEPNQS